jgi:hypothetical protein
MAIGLFGALLYIALIYAGFVEFRSRMAKRGNNKKRSRNAVTDRRLRNPKVSGH